MSKLSIKISFDKSRFVEIYFLLSPIACRLFLRMGNQAEHATLVDVLFFLGVENNGFMRRAFSIFDEDSSGAVDFGEFVVSMWNYCTLSSGSLVLFAFDLYDEDRSGLITRHEVKELMTDIFGDELKNNKFAKATLAKIEAVVENTVDTLNIENFKELCRKHPTILFGAAELQSKIQRKVLGNSFWSKLAEVMLEMPDGTRLTIAQYKDLVGCVTRPMCSTVITTSSS